MGVGEYGWYHTEVIGRRENKREEKEGGDGDEDEDETAKVP